MINELLDGETNVDTIGTKITRGIFQIEDESIKKHEREFGILTYFIIVAVCLRLQPDAIDRTGRKMFTKIPEKLKKVKKKKAKKVYRRLKKSLLQEMPFIVGTKVFFKEKTQKIDASIFSVVFCDCFEIFSSVFGKQKGGDEFWKLVKIFLVCHSENKNDKKTHRMIGELRSLIGVCDEIDREDSDAYVDYVTMKNMIKHHVSAKPKKDKAAYGVHDTGQMLKLIVILSTIISHSNPDLKDDSRNDFVIYTFNIIKLLCTPWLQGERGYRGFMKEITKKKLKLKLHHGKATSFTPRNVESEKEILEVMLTTDRKWTKIFDLNQRYIDSEFEGYVGTANSIETNPMAKMNAGKTKTCVFCVHNLIGNNAYLPLYEDPRTLYDDPIRTIPGLLCPLCSLMDCYIPLRKSMKDSGYTEHDYEKWFQDRNFGNVEDNHTLLFDMNPETGLYYMEKLTPIEMRGTSKYIKLPTGINNKHIWNNIRNNFLSIDGNILCRLPITGLTTNNMFR